MQPNIVKSAMLNGLIMGVLFSLNFLLSVSQNTFLSLLSYVVFAAILVGTYRFALRFRDTECGGFISYGRAFSFVLLLFFFAALISSIVKYVYFQYINPAYLENLINESMKAIEMMKIPVDDAAYENVEKMMKPASFSLQYLWVNVFAGTFVGLIMAAFIKKEKSIFE